MTTVKNTPEPPKNVTPRPAPPRSSAISSRPTSGGAPQPGRSEGNPPALPPPGVVPSMDAYRPSGPAPVTTGGTQTGPDFGHGATIVIRDSGDRPSGGKADANLGTVGASGDQGAGPGGMPGA
jgi:hypothetical protein